MITEQELKSQCTPNVIKKMCVLTDYFYASNDKDCEQIIGDEQAFPLLIHRAVEGWNKEAHKDYSHIEIDNLSVMIVSHNGFSGKRYPEFKNYQPESLTACELACLHCLVEILKEEV